MIDVPLVDMDGSDRIIVSVIHETNYQQMLHNARFNSLNDTVAFNFALFFLIASQTSFIYIIFWYDYKTIAMMFIELEHLEYIG